jgi:CheY-like chemotaxis protein/anti-sigma regulatory factor (Ser/Thr protein kinase)
VQVQLRSFALADIFDQLRAELVLIAAEKGLRLRIRPSAVGVVSDPALLRRILLNLLGNSLRYTHTGGVLLACRRTADAGRVRIEIWDSGIGIALEHQEAIFREFYQVGNVERDRGKGMGLGLNIVERTAKLLGHRLQMRSRPGVGTRFSIEVPRASGALELERRSPPRSGVIDHLAGLVVMVIEDDALAREALVGLLASWGSTVIEADGLSTAQARLKEGVFPDVIISDFRLRNGENGIDAIRQLRAAAEHTIPACLISGDTDPDVMQQVKQASLRLLHKPVRPAKLRSLLSHLAGDAHAGRAPLP